MTDGRQLANMAWIWIIGAAMAIYLDCPAEAVYTAVICSTVCVTGARICRVVQKGR